MSCWFVHNFVLYLLCAKAKSAVILSCFLFCFVAQVLYTDFLKRVIWVKIAPPQDFSP